MLPLVKIAALGNQSADCWSFRSAIQTAVVLSRLAKPNNEELPQLKERSENGRLGFRSSFDGYRMIVSSEMALLLRGGLAGADSS